MVFLAEILFTVFAWRSGWRWYSLLPPTIGLILQAYLGTIVAFSGGTTDITWTVIFNLGAIVALIVMCAKKPKLSTNETQKLLNN